MFTDEQGHQGAINRRTAVAMSRELHNTAQPLTVLHGVLEIALEKAHTVEDYRQFCQRAIAELQRVAEGFDRVRKLLRSSDRDGKGMNGPRMREQDTDEGSASHSTT